MSRPSLTWPRLSRSEWDRPAADTRLLPHPFPNPVSLGSPRSPYRRSPVASALSQSPVRKLPVLPYSRPIQAAYARSALPGVDADACVNSWMNARSALPGVERMPALTPRMISRSALPGVDADACVSSWMNARSALPGVERMPALTPRMNARSALPGVDADACANPADDLSRPFPYMSPTSERALATPSSPSIPMPCEGSLTPTRQFTPREV